MSTLLVITTGQTDVQLVANDLRQKLAGKNCGQLHDVINTRQWVVVDSPKCRSSDAVTEIVEANVSLCTPKLDAVLSFLPMSPTSVLIFETTRQNASDPRLAGAVVAQRLRDRGIDAVTRMAFLTGNETLEDASVDVDAVIRRAVVAKISNAIGRATQNLCPGDRVYVAATGGLAAANEVINELVRLHCVSGPRVTALEVPDGVCGTHEDKAVEESFDPAAGARARWHALSLIEKGNLLGAWGAVSHLHEAPGQEWTQVIQWLARFASSLPLPEECNLAVLSHPRMAVRAALRVELALRLDDIPRAVHGTVAFLEAALWDKLLEHFERDVKDNRCLRLKAGSVSPTGNLLRSGADCKSDKAAPFERKSRNDGHEWFWFHESGAGRFARDYVKSNPLKKLVDAVNEEVKALRNDVAHNEPTPSLMQSASDKMQSAGLWSNKTFLSETIVQEVLQDLGESQPAHLLNNLLAEVRRRLVDVAEGVAK